MSNEIRTIIYDKELNVEAYNFKGIMQSFPNHFHTYYVIGFIEKGERFLTSKNKEYQIGPGDIIIFNPKDNHSCYQIKEELLDYRCINIKCETMENIMSEITGENKLPYFKEQVVLKSDLYTSIRDLHLMISNESEEFKRYELLYFIVEQLVNEYAVDNYTTSSNTVKEKIELVCTYLDANFKNKVSLEELVKITGLSKYYLIRCFTKEKGISPYCYLETIRIDYSKKLLEKGVLPIDVALEVGFSDQSHFSKLFKKYIGITPKQYMNIFKVCES